MQVWRKGRAGTGWAGKHILSRVGVAGLVIEVVGGRRGLFKREEARCDVVMIVELLADGVVGDGWIPRSFICMRNNAYLHPYYLPPSAIVPHLQQPEQAGLPLHIYPQTLLNPHKPPI